MEKIKLRIYIQIVKALPSEPSNHAYINISNPEQNINFEHWISQDEYEYWKPVLLTIGMLLKKAYPQYTKIARIPESLEYEWEELDWETIVPTSFNNSTNERRKN